MNNNSLSTLLVIIFAFLVACLIFSMIVVKIAEISRENKYIKREIKRTNGEEKKFWKAELRHSYLYYLPFTKK